MTLRKLNRQKLKGLRPASRRRRNPDAPFGVMPAKWKEATERGKQEARAMLLGVRAELVSAGIPQEALPEPFELNRRSDEIGTLIASSEYADLAAQSKLDTPSKKVAEQVFSVFEKVETEKSAKPVLDKARRVFASRLDTLRAPALAKRKAAGTQVRKASEDAAEEALLRKREQLEALRARAAAADAEDDIEDEGDEDDDDEDVDDLYAQAKTALKIMKRSDPDRATFVAFVKAYESGDPDAIMKTFAAVRELAEKATSVEEEATEEVVEERVERRPRGQRAAAEPRQTRRARRAPIEVVEEEEEIEEIPSVAISRGGERLAGYAQYRARERKRVPLSEGLRKETANDILLYVLNDRTTQVWIKGSLTETFVASRGRASWKVASSYAKNWLETPGRTGEPKKSRLGMRVVVATESEPEKYEVVVAAKSGVGTPAEKPVSLATVVEQLRAEPKSRSNPRSRQGFLRNPFSRQVVADVREVFRRSNPVRDDDWLMDLFYSQGKEGARQVREERARTAEKKRVRESLRKKLAEGRFTPVRSNPRGLSVGQTLTVGYRTFTIVRVLPGEVVVAVDHGDGPEMYRVEETTKAAVLRSLEERFGNRSNPRKLAVPEHVAKTPRAAGTRLSAIGVKGAWPIGDLFHARLAAIYIMSPSHRAKKAQVLAALERHYPQYDWRGFISRSGTLRQVANPGQTTLRDSLLDDKLMYGRKLSLVRDDSFRGDRLDYKVMQKVALFPGGQNVWSADRTDIVLRFPAADTVEVYIAPRGKAREMVGSLRLRADASPEDGAVAVRNMLYSMTTGFSIAGAARYANIKAFFTESGYEPSTSVW